jgi:DNA-binding IclR family transcriptional regulator
MRSQTGDVTPMVAAIGAPNFDDTDKVPAGLSLGGIRDTLLGHEARALEMFLEGARRLARSATTLTGR